MMKRNILTAAVLLVAVIGTARADFALTGTSHLDVTTAHTNGVLHNSSSVDVKSGGYVYYLYPFNASSVNMSDGYVRYLNPDDTSSVHISGGEVFQLYAYDTSSVNISGGSFTYLTTHESSSMDISGGYGYTVFANDTSSVNISGGSFTMLVTSGSSSMDISGGITGGTTVPYLFARDSSVVTFYGRNFRVAGGLVFDGDYVLGEGVLAGEWFDGTLWAVNIVGHDTSATILAVRAPPEPLHILTIDVDPNDVGIDTITPSVGAHDYAGVWVSIKAERFINCPDVYTFAHWDGDVNDPNSANTRVFMDSDKTITAVFVDDRQCGDECHPYPSGDVNKDCKVDFLDIAMVASSWLECTRPECD